MNKVIQEELGDIKEEGEEIVVSEKTDIETLKQKHELEELKLAEYIRGEVTQWQPRKFFPLPGRLYSGITTCGTLTGCGLMQMRGSSNSKDPGFKETLSLAQKTHKSNAGLILATLGDAYIRTAEPALLDAGFVLLAQYNNPVHGARYKQRLYGLFTKEADLKAHLKKQNYAEGKIAKIIQILEKK